MIKVRFAPSPTGYLHVGNARTALINYLFARNQRGTFCLRIEDTDIERSDTIYEVSILDDLAWLGINWDEGPFRQSERIDVYKDYAVMLIEKGFAYKCFCTKDELEQMRKRSLAFGRPPRYNGQCRGLAKDAVEALEKEGRQYVVRFRSPMKPVSFKDHIHGDISFPFDHVDDFVILKQGDTPSYNFAAAIDDMLMDITHVIRGADHISNTPKQIMLFNAFSRMPPAYAHHSLLIGSDRKPLSKRHGATRIREFREIGILREAMVNYLGINGRNVEKEIMSKDELAETFTLNSLSPSDSIFDMEKLIWFNKEYIKNMPVERLIHEAGLPEDTNDRVQVLRENAKTTEELKGLLAIFDGASIDEDAISFVLSFKGIDTITSGLEVLLKQNDDIGFEAILNELSSTIGLSRKELMMALRVIITGKKSGPPLKELYRMIPKNSIMMRIECLKKRLLHA